VNSGKSDCVTFEVAGSPLAFAVIVTSIHGAVTSRYFSFTFSRLVLIGGTPTWKIHSIAKDPPSTVSRAWR